MFYLIEMHSNILKDIKLSNKCLCKTYLVYHIIDGLSYYKYK